MNIMSSTNLGRNGVYDWLVQRVTSLVMAAYLFVVVGFILLTPDMTYDIWSEFFAQTWVRVFSLMMVISVAMHAWIGLWCVLNDYVTVRLMGPKATALRLTFQFVLGMITAVYFLWGLEILWGL